MVTPEAVAPEFRTANLGSRILAYLIDMVVVVAGSVVGLFAVALIGQASDVVVPDWVALRSSWCCCRPGGSATSSPSRPCMGADPRQGRPGAAGGDQGGGAGPVPPRGHPGLLGLVDFLVIGGFIAVVFILFSRDNQRLGDMVAGTWCCASAAPWPPRRRSASRRRRGWSTTPPPWTRAGSAPRVPGGQDVPAPGGQPAPRSPLGPGPAAGQPAGGPPAPPPRPGSPPSSTSTAWPPPTSSASAWPPGRAGRAVGEARAGPAPGGPSPWTGRVRPAG